MHFENTFSIRWKAHENVPMNRLQTIFIILSIELNTMNLSSLTRLLSNYRNSFIISKEWHDIVIDPF